MLASAVLMMIASEVVVPVDDVGPDLRSALAAARIERAVALARKDYTSSDFARCIERVRAVEDEIPARVMIGTWHEAKAAYLWLGLCEAVAGEANAAAHLALSRRLPGPPPESGLLPPSVRALYEQETGAVCTFPASPTARVVDGDQASGAVKLAVGPHLFVSPSPPHPHAARMRVTDDCDLLREADDRSARSSLSSEERRDVALLTSIASTLGVDRLVLRGADGRAQLFDAKTSAIVDAPQPPPSAPTTTVERSEPLFWFFTGAGAAAAVAAVVGVAIAVSATNPAPSPSQTYVIGF